MRTGSMAVVLCCSLLAVAVGGAVALSGPVATGADPPPWPVEGSNGAVSADPDSGDGSSPGCPTGPTNETRETAAALETAETPRIAEIYPNTRYAGNVGEYLVLEVPEGVALENVTVTDGHTTAGIPADSPAGRVAYGLDSEATESLTTHPVRELEGHLRLSVEGDDLELRDGNGVVDRASYDRAAVGERWYRASLRSDDEPANGIWWPRGSTCRNPASVTDVEATAFALPDSPDVVREEVASAEERIRLGAYTFTDEDVAADLEAAADRGVDVEVLVEASPVGGLPAETGPVLDSLTDAGVAVRAVGGEGSRYAYHHPKYAVVDDRALVTTENWAPSGVGGTSSRGWGAVVESEVMADELEAVFRADATGPDAVDWADHRDRATFVVDDPPGDPYPEAIDPKPVRVDEAELLLAPDNAEDRIREELRGAEESILVKQARIGDRRLSLLEETLAAARDGVEVRILLDASWYVEEENRAVADWLANRAEREGLPLEVRLVDSGSAFEKIHAKGIVVDGETAIVGSVNWNEHSLRENREVALVLRGDDVAGFYADVFEADWDGETWPVPLDLLGIVAIVLVGAGLVGRRYVDLHPAGSSTASDSRSRGERIDRAAAPFSERADEAVPRTTERERDETGRERARDGYGSSRSESGTEAAEKGAETGAERVLNSRAGRRSRAPRRCRRRPSSRRGRR